MLIRSLPVLLVLAVLGQAEEKKSLPASAKRDALELFKTLAGEWVGQEVKGPNEGKEVRAVYKTTSAGSAVVETLFPGADHEMVTVVHRDGNDLVLTHYCALGNQPHMKAPGKVNDNTIAFRFVRGTNLSPESDPHMHDVAFTFVDKDTLRSEWTYFKDGKPGGAVVFEMKRKK